MNNLNSVQIEGNLTGKPELRYAGDRAVTTLTVAVNRSYTPKGGEKKEEVSFIDVDVWGSQAETCAEHLEKGQTVIVEGSLIQQRWEKDGQKRSKLVIAAESIHFRRKAQKKSA